MKTGKAAKIFDVDPKTILSWTETFAAFFSHNARGDNRVQRDYNPDDIIVLNTIHVARSENKDMEEIRLMLEAGQRNPTLPPQAAVMGADQAMTVFAQLKQSQTALEQMQEALRKSDGENAELKAENKRLQREVGMWEGRYLELKDRFEADD
jgi:DNA-binding transcriptional MerR regulator